MAKVKLINAFSVSVSVIYADVLIVFSFLSKQKNTEIFVAVEAVRHGMVDRRVTSNCNLEVKSNL